MPILYKFEEVAKHNRPNDLWVIIHNGIYDLTKFLKEHPGGEEVLLNAAGNDGTECFDAIGHSTEAIQLREMYKIGDLEDGDSEKKKEEPSGEKIINQNQLNVTDEEPWDYVEHKEENSPLIYILLSLALPIYAIIFYYIF